MLTELKTYIGDFLVMISQYLAFATLILSALFGGFLAIESKCNIFEMSVYTLKNLTKKWFIVSLISFGICIFILLIGLTILKSAH